MKNDVFTDMAGHAPMAAVTRVGEATSLVTGETVTGNYFELRACGPSAAGCWRRRTTGPRPRGWP